MAISYSNLTSTGEAAVLREAEKNGCKVSYEGGKLVVYDGNLGSCAEALALNYDNGDGRGIFSDRARY